MVVFPSSTNHWKITNDSVMGGLSNGRVLFGEDLLLFSGAISTENNGGFTSAFVQLPQKVHSAQGILICVKGDGNKYQLRVRTQIMDHELAYKVEFNTQPDVEENLYFNLSDFVANFRGRSLENAPTLKPDKITHLGFLLREYEPKTFNLSVYSISFT